MPPRRSDHSERGREFRWACGVFQSAQVDVVDETVIDISAIYLVRDIEQLIRYIFFFFLLKRLSATEILRMRFWTLEAIDDYNA